MTSILASYVVILSRNPLNLNMATHSNDIHKAYLLQALECAKRSPPKPTNYCVGAVLVSLDGSIVLSTGYTLECEGNTHAEQCCFIKTAAKLGVTEELLAEVLPPSVLYTTMEPCSMRLSGNKSCVQRILDLKASIRTVYVGVKEPETFVGENEGRQKLEDAGIQVVHVQGLEAEILEIATSGHVKA